MQPLRLAVVGTGYVGLVSGVCLAALGHDVTCIDRDAGKIAKLQNGEIPIYEPGLDLMVQENVRTGRLHFTTDLVAALQGRQIVLIAVGTPTAADSVSADLSAVFAVADTIAPHLHDYKVIVTKSTVPVGTNRQIAARVKAANVAAQFDIASNPEFLREGSAIEDFMRPDRIVVGTDSERAKELLQQLYKPLTTQSYKLLTTSPESAELIKYASNAFLATKVAFINEVADIAERCGGEIADIAHGIGLDQRIGSRFLQAGPGYGGSCFPKDTRAFAQTGRQSGAPSSIVEAVIAANDMRKSDMATRIIKGMGNVKGKKIAALGVTFKPNTDDMRDSVALDVIPTLIQAGAEVHAFDPTSSHQAVHLLPKNVYWCQTMYEPLQNADALVILCDWPEFKTLDLSQIGSTMKQKLLFDWRNLFAASEAKAAGFIYHSIGRAVVT